MKFENLAEGGDISVESRKGFPCIVPVLVLFAIFAARGEAYHSGGVADCEGCHTMHNAYENFPMDKVTPLGTAGPYLLKGNDQSSVCLNCHEHSGDVGPTGYHDSTPSDELIGNTPPRQLPPGGDFGWLKKSYSWTPVSTVPGVNLFSLGERHGHNIVALDYGYLPDTTFAKAPGGAYPSTVLHCSSCHDPHGKSRIMTSGVQATAGKPIKDSGSYGAEPDANLAVGVYRLLGGAGYEPKSLKGRGFAFLNAAPYAVAPRDYNRTEDVTDTRVAYGKGVSLWCANCHENMHSTSGFVHPSDDALGSDVIAIYNSYRKTGDLTGTIDNAYNSLVPFQMNNSTDLRSLKSATTSRTGPVSGDRVMCLSCHRAHASGFDSILRWNNGSPFLTVIDNSGKAAWADPLVNPEVAMGRAPHETKKAYYDRPATAFSPFQKSLCNKCHARD